MTTFRSPTSSPESFDISVSPMRIVKTRMALTSYMFLLIDDLHERLHTANMEEVYPTDLLERPQQTFLWYKL